MFGCACVSNGDRMRTAADACLCLCVNMCTTTAPEQTWLHLYACACFLLHVCFCMYVCMRADVVCVRSAE